MKMEKKIDFRFIFKIFKHLWCLKNYIETYDFSDDLSQVAIE